MFNDNGSFLLALFEFFIFFAWIMCVFYVFADIFRSHDMGGGGEDCLVPVCHLRAIPRRLGLSHRPRRRHDGAHYGAAAGDAATAG